MKTSDENTLTIKNQEFCGVFLVLVATVAISKLAELIL